MTRSQAILTNHVDWFNEALRTNRKGLLRHLNSGGEYRVDDTPYIGSNRNTALALVINNIRMDMLMNSSDIKASITDHAELINTLLKRGEDANLPSSINTHGQPVGWRLILPLLNNLPRHPLSITYPDVTLKLCTPLVHAGFDLTLPMMIGRKNRYLMDYLTSSFNLQSLIELFRLDVSSEVKRQVISRPVMVKTYTKNIAMSPIGALVKHYRSHTIRNELFADAIKGMVSWGGEPVR